MGNFLVFDYELDENNYIKGWRVEASSDRPDLVGIDPPLLEMQEPGALYDIFGNLKYKLMDGKIILQKQKPTQNQLKKIQDKEIERKINNTININEQIAEIRKALYNKGIEVSFYSLAEEIKKQVRGDSKWQEI